MLSITNISARSISRSLLFSSRFNNNISKKLTNIRCNNNKKYNSSSQPSYCISKRWKGDTAESTKSNKGSSSSSNGGFLQRFLAPKPMPPKYTTKWYGEMVLICTVFGITGSSTWVYFKHYIFHFYYYLFCVGRMLNTLIMHIIIII